MRIWLLSLGICFTLYSVLPVCADTVYSWTDAAGVIHISQSKPPEDARQPSRLAYTQSKPPDTQGAAASAQEKQLESNWLSTLEQARRERKNADQARKSAQDAIQAANLLKKETDEFLAAWKNKNRIKRALMRQIEDRIQQANQGIEQAKALVQRANEAEQTARQAEMEAKRLEQELFEQYHKIMSN